ncbi:flavin monoamine oxidase family protein [Acinetobacter rudis]|uniref:flavin monoamine oxidase family protein n=1 Tax=Acinetobacter rudis TaxID=632955 RepID=UPI0033408969
MSTLISSTTHEQLPIIVVGAGTAGLSCAKTLQEAGKKVLILEARSRIGGRIHSTQQHVAFDLGASWIHGIEENPIWDITQQNHINTTVFNYIDSDFYHADGRIFSELEQQTVVQYLERIEQGFSTSQAANAALALEEILIQLQAPNNSFTKSQLDDLARIYFERFANDPFATTLTQLSTHFADYEGYFSGDEVIFPAGYSQVIDVLAKDLEISCNVQIQQIIRHAEYVELINQHGHAYQAKQVIVTVPLGVLKKNVIDFQPDLPQSLQQTIAQYGFGSFNKVFIELEHALPLHKNSLQEQKSIFYFHDQVCYNLLDLFFVYQKPVYLLLFGGPQSEWIDQATDEAVWQLIRSSLVDNFADIPTRPKTLHITRWGSDPYSYGSFSFPMPEHSASLSQTFQQSIDQQLYFAGEHCQHSFAGTVHGAYISGQETAQLLLQDLVD